MRYYILFITFLLCFVSGFSQKAEKLLEQGRASFRSGNRTEAINSFTACIDKSDLPECYARRATVYYYQSENTKAMDDINIAISKETNVPGWYYTQRADIYAALKNFDAAFIDIKKAFEIEGTNKPYYNRGYIYYLKSDYENAIADFNSAINQSPTNPAYYYRCQSYISTNKINEALKDAQTLIDKYPNSGNGYYFLGVIYSNQRKYDLAIKELELGLNKAPSNAAILFYLSRAYYYKNDFQKALSYIDQSLTAYPYGDNYLFKGRIYYYGLQNIEEANKCFNKAIEEEKDKITPTTAYAMLFLGKDEEAINLLKSFISEKSNGNIYLSLACFYAILDREAEAVESLEKAYALGYPKNSNLLGLTDLDNIKLKKSFRDLLAKNGIPYDLDNKTLIQIYIKTTVNRWQKRGKYEKADEYLARVNEASRKKYIEAATKDAIQYVGRMKVEPRITKTEYNPDIETFKIFFPGGQQALVKVPVAEAKVFDTNLGKLEPTMTFALDKDENFVIEQISIKNPVNNKTYQGNAVAINSFSTSELSLDFAPVQTYLDKYKTQESSPSAPQAKAPKLSVVDTNIPLSAKRKDKTFALVIGNEDYSSFQPDLNAEVNVDYAVNDAKIFKEYLKKTIGIPDENIFLYTNATAGQMKQAINKMEKLAKAYNGEAELIFFFAGHGLPDENSHESYIMPVDISGSTIQYAIKLNDVYSQLSVNPTKRILVFLDACFSGGARNEGLTALRSVKVNPKSEVLSNNMVVFASSSGTQSSMALDDEQHGLFTYYLLKKLNETKGEISLDDLGKYLGTEVNRKAILLKNREQTPQVIVNPSVGSGILLKKLSD